MSQPNQYAQPQPPPPPTVPVQGPVTISPVIVVGQHVHYSHVNHAPLPNAAAPPLAVSNAAMTGVPAATGSYQYTAPAPVYQIPAPAPAQNVLPQGLTRQGSSQGQLNPQAENRKRKSPQPGM